MAITVLAITVLAIGPFLTRTLTDLAADRVGLAAEYLEKPLVIQLALYVHIVGGTIALVIGPLQFLSVIRKRWPKAHRWVGRVYLAAVAISALAALAMAPFTSVGVAGLIGFGAFVVLWVLTAWRGYRAIRVRDVRSHNAWMIRNYAVTYSAVTLRLWLPLLVLTTLALTPEADAERVYASTYGAAIYIAVLPNLIVAEWIIRRRGLPSYRLGAAPARRGSAQRSAAAR